MSENATTSLRQTLRITIDVEVAFRAIPTTQTGSTIEETFYRSLLDSLKAHPEVLTKLQRGLAVNALSSAKKALEAEYGWQRNSEQQLIQLLMEDLGPDVQAYFTEEVEERASLYNLGDVSEAIIKRYTLTELTTPEENI